MTDALDLVRENGLFVLGLLTLTAGAITLQRWAHVHLGWQPLVAILRAMLQLGVIALILQGVLATPWTVVLFVLVMLATASLTSGGRIRHLYRGRQAAVLGVVSASLVTIAWVFALHLMDWNVRYLIAVAGIIIGNAMSAATLSGRNFAHLTAERGDEIEGWLALGAPPPRAHREIGEFALKEMLIPGIDQTRATGLVTLPGAFVGALMGGASPLEAAKFQLVVLAGIGLAMTVCGIVVTRIAGRSPTVPRPELAQ